MVETFLSGIAENLLGKIASLALDEVALSWGLETDLRKLYELLTTVKAVLLDAEEKQAQSPSLRAWLGRLKNFCYDAEDVLDEFEYEGLRKEVLKRYGNAKMKMHRFFSSSNPLVFRLKMGHKVKELTERLDEIADYKSKFHLSELVDYRQLGRRSREMTDSLLHMKVFGRDGDKENILNFLLQLKEGEIVSVIPIVGLRGVGKSTLAKMLFNDESVKNHFDLRIWVWVSKIFEKKEIMVSMIKSLTARNCSDLDPGKLQRQIRENLNSKRFLLVLDDVWSDDRGKWMEFVELLGGGAVGSKVIVTTRNDSVADTVRTVTSYRLKCLSAEDCLFLFKKFAFRDGEEESHPHLIEIGEDIVKKCGGIPLAVKTMGTLLYSKLDRRYWEYIRDSEMWTLVQNENDILLPLKLSYYQLPSYLKPCFAIFSIYPKGHQFDSSELCQIWMANGLLQSSNRQDDMEDIGVQYIKELYSRSFLQDLEVDGSLIRFKMEDIVHDLAMLISQSECFAVHTGIEEVPGDGIRHLSFSKASLDKDVSKFLPKENRLRTIVVPYSLEQPSVESSVYTCIFASKYLRMLHPPQADLKKLPSSISGLKHLRCLTLPNNDGIKRLPPPFWKLYNLLFLDVTGFSRLEELPKDVRNLVKLRHLSVSTEQKRFPRGGIGCLRSLRRLYISNCLNLENLFEDIHHLTSLRLLDLSICAKLISLPRNLINLNALEDLYIKRCDRFNWMKEDDIEDVWLSLRLLDIVLLPQVVTLPLWLKKSSRTLQQLRVDCCENFSSFPEWLQDFTSLEEVCIIGCPKLVSMPEWMPRLTALKKLTVGNCPVLSERCKRLEGEDWDKIAHVPDIKIDGELIRP